MEAFRIVSLSISGFFIIFWLFILLRIKRVSNFRGEIINKIFEFDVYIHRLEKFHTVTFDTMVKKFWKPLTVKSFYGDDDFLK